MLFDKMYPIVDSQGWTDNTVLGLALEYIEAQQDDNAFLDFLRDRCEDSDEDYL